MKRIFLLSVILLFVSCAKRFGLEDDKKSQGNVRPSPERWVFVAKVPDWLPENVFQKDSEVIQVRGLLGGIGQVSIRAKLHDTTVEINRIEFADEDMLIRKHISESQLADTATFKRLLKKFQDYNGERWSGTGLCFDGNGKKFAGTVYFCSSECFLLDTYYCSANPLEITRLVDEFLKYSQESK